MKSKDVRIWGQTIPYKLLSKLELDYLSKFDFDNIISLEELWLEMDKVWDSYNLDNKKPFYLQNISGFYSHPIWILNGIYSASDKLSSFHRKSIANFISGLECNGHICDFGGGFGELATQISKTLPSYKIINIVEPFPSKIGEFRISNYNNIKLTPTLSSNYDVLIAQDVLEHVEKPLNVTMELVNSVKVNGYLIFANCFYPYIKAHLPGNFYLASKFHWIMKGYGLRFIGNLPNSPHIQIFQKTGEANVFLISIRNIWAKFFWKLRAIKSYLA